ncbi:Ger(x)C family spore germination protein [Paenibacillus sp. PL91]|uniref:Ger(x)C family spore germination protein n=1 Tax=Paenibacillus sp. PL91 TaxID=2729538 RepID=UPI00145C5ED6|nr:Ger(x)C family spore germination protein [Paenibacillus sp. PL91]MBC9204545.1 Ger(x)C family spore germination protein [Paenibacillus sp. PL91]
MNKTARLLLAICVTAASLSIAGCWDSAELNKTSLITGIALEPGKHGKLRLTVETMIAKRPEESKDTTPSIVQSLEGNSLPDLLVRFNESLDRSLLISHIGVIIIDERLARQGIQYLMDPLQRTRFIREDVLVLISEGVHASQIFKVLYPRKLQASSKIVSQLKSYRSSRGGVPQSRLYDVSETFLAEGRELLLASISLKGSMKDADKMESIKMVTPKASIVITGAGIFSEDKLKGFISVEESRMVMMASNQVKTTTLAIPYRKHDVSIRLRHIDSDIDAFMEKGKVKIQVKLEAEGAVSSIDESIDITKISGYEKLEKLGSDYLEQQMSETIRSIQKRFGLDVFGFGEHMYRMHYAQFAPLAERWNNVFASTPVTVKVNIRLRRSELKTKHIKNEGVGP